ATKYVEAIRVGETALIARPDSVTAREYLIRSLIQEERWPEAESHLDALTRFAPARDVSYLKGFLQRRRGDTRRALEFYKEAERLGRRGAAISRELAVCYFLLGDRDTASRYVEESLRRHRENRFVIDLWAQIAIARRDEGTAR